jgi:hypothetical protein
VFANAEDPNKGVMQVSPLNRRPRFREGAEEFQAEVDRLMDIIINSLCKLGDI